MEKEFLEVLKTSSDKFVCRLEADLKELVAEMFDFESMKQYLQDLGVDLARVPLGKLTAEKIKRGHGLLSEIQKLLISEDPKKHQTLLVNLSNDIYCAIPHNFGIQKAPTIDHLLRVKEKTRMLEQVLQVVEMQSIFTRALQFELRQSHPLDVLYNDLCVRLTRMNPEQSEFVVISEAMQKT